MTENLMDGPVPPLPQITNTMKLLITDLKASRTKENGEHVDRLINAAEYNYFDDIKGISRFAVPTVELLVMAQRCQLHEIVKNCQAGKYDVPQKTTEQ